MKYTLFRDDDVSYTTDWRLLDESHRLITTAGGTHAVAVLMDRLWDNKETWLWLMTAPDLKIGLHGWRHDDYSKLSRQRIVGYINRSLDYYRDHTGHYPNAPQIDTFYPPWNRVSDELRSACEECGLILDSRWKKGSDVYGFHSWELIIPSRRQRLEKALRS